MGTRLDAGISSRQRPRGATRAGGGRFRGVSCAGSLEQGALPWRALDLESRAGKRGFLFAARRRNASAAGSGPADQRMTGPPLHLKVREREAEPEALVTVTVTVMVLPMLQLP